MRFFAEETRRPGPNPNPCIAALRTCEPVQPAPSVSPAAPTLVTPLPSSPALPPPASSPSTSTVFVIAGNAPASVMVPTAARGVPGRLARIDIGWFELKGSGNVELENDPDFSAYSYSCSMENLLLFAGASVALKPLDDIPLYASLGAGFATTYSWAESTYQREGDEPMDNAVQAGWGVGYYIGVEAAYELGPGRFILEYRYSSIKADLGFENVYGGQYSQQQGDLGGSNILLGYRLNIPW